MSSETRRSLFALVALAALGGVALGVWLFQAVAGA